MLGPPPDIEEIPNLFCNIFCRTEEVEASRQQRIGALDILYDDRERLSQTLKPLS